MSTQICPPFLLVSLPFLLLLLGPLFASAAPAETTDNSGSDVKSSGKVCVGLTCPEPTVLYHYECCGTLHNDCCWYLENWVKIALVLAFPVGLPAFFCLLSMMSKTSKNRRIDMGGSKHFKGGTFNTIIHFVPHQQAWIVERMGKFRRILEPGVHFVIPIIESIRYRHCLKEMCIEIPQQEAITKDNVQLDLDAVLYVRVVDPYKASYGVQCPEYAISQLAQTVMRAEVGKLMLDNVFHERANLNMAIVEGIKESAAPWGLICLRYEIRTMTMPPEIQRAMKMQVEAERKKRAMILESEGICEAEKNKAEGEKQARILRSEAQMMEQMNKSQGLAKAAEAEKVQRILQSEAEMQSQINRALALAKSAESEKESKIVLARAEEQVQVHRAQGLAKAIDLEAGARAGALERMALGLEKSGGQNAAAYLTADNFVKAFSNLAKQTNTVVVPANPADVGGMVAQAMAIYGKVANATANGPKSST